VKGCNKSGVGVLEQQATRLRNHVVRRNRVLRNCDPVPPDELAMVEEAIHRKFNNRNYSVRKEVQIIYYYCADLESFRKEIYELISISNSLPDFVSSAKRTLDKLQNI